jgi:hypothetical protein
MRTGALRRSIITQQLGTTANISWRSPYAKAQDEGGHTVHKPIKGPNKRDGGYGTIMPGRYKYSHYTTTGTGPGFAMAAFRKTKEEMDEFFTSQGFTK